MERAAWNTLQRIEFVLSERTRLQKELGKAVHEPLLTKHLKAVTMAESSEPLNKSFVDACLTIESRLLSIPSCREVLHSFEDASVNHLCSPLASVYQLNTVTGKVEQMTTSQEILERSLDHDEW